MSAPRSVGSGRAFGRWALGLAGLALLVWTGWPVQAEIIYETTSPYHHIQVIDEGGVRTLSFDGTQESQMSLVDPLRRHFEYTEYFHLPWLWNDRIEQVLMIGLGGASTQRLFAHYYPEVTVETVELDREVLKVARDYFHFQEGPRQRVHIEDGRVFVRRSTKQYDVLIVDAYRRGRYGSFIPYHLATREFFELARQRLTTNGVIAYNVISSIRGYQADILGAIYRTLNEVFPQVYVFPVRQSDNVVLIATRSPVRRTLPELRRQANDLTRSQRVKLWNFKTRVNALRETPLPNLKVSPVLKDDFAPVDGLLSSPNLDAVPRK